MRNAARRRRILTKRRPSSRRTGVQACRRERERATVEEVEEMTTMTVREDGVEVGAEEMMMMMAQEVEAVMAGGEVEGAIVEAETTTKPRIEARHVYTDWLALSQIEIR